MEQEALMRERKSHGRSKPRPAQPTLCSTLALISRLLFYRPVWTENNQDETNVRFVFVRFSAWHFAGSDLLWAGLVMRLCLALQYKFGKLQLGLYRIVQHEEEIAELKKKIEDGVASWRSIKICCFPIWFLLGLVASAAVVILTLLILFGFPKSEEGEESTGSEQENSSGFGVLEGFAIATLGVPAAGAIRFTFLLGKNLAFNQDFNVRRSMDNQKVSERLGFMNEVRKEMRLLSRFIHFMEVFERRKIRVVLEITNLDRCTPQKIVGVLDAINILLSDEESPFVSLLAVDPEVLVEQVNNADCCYSQRDNAFGFLDRIITLPFTVPPLCVESKRTVFGNIVYRHSEAPDILPGTDDMKANAVKASKSSLALQDDFTSNGKRTHEEASISLIPHNSTTEDLKEGEMEKVIQAAFRSILQPTSSPLHEYISSDTMSMRRVINSIRVTVVIMEELPHIQLPLPDRLAAWVVLADCWPCRLSWILQCIEDDQQRKEIDQGIQGESMTAIPSWHSAKILWDVFSQHRLELHLMVEEVEDLLERDGDPELFEKFLKVDFPFTVTEAKTFVQSTVNLDLSIKRKLARLRGSNRLNDPTWKNSFFSLSKQQVINMSVEDICKEMSRVHLSEKYANIVKSNHLDGRALLLNEPSDVKRVLQMTLGEWTTFKTTFLVGKSFGGPSGEGRRENRPGDMTQPVVTVCTSMPCHTTSSKTTNV